VVVFGYVFFSLLEISLVFCSYFLKLFSRFVIQSSLASFCELVSEMYSFAFAKAVAVACNFQWLVKAF
jgi:hypothetical protein